MSYKSYTIEERRRIFDTTSGRCHITHNKLRFSSYGKFEESDGWEVDHSRPLAQGGTNHMNNLRPILISVNREKQDRSAREMRNEYGKTRPPLSRAQEKRREESSSVWGDIFLGLGLAALGLVPVGAAVLTKKMKGK